VRIFGRGDWLTGNFVGYTLGLATAWFWLWAAPLVNLRETPLSIAGPEPATA
jgi:hypothetical protein